ncbi:MAG: Beta-hexosaminidase, partial [Alphaproteobacteria bacterium MarineAlpha8_Bin1]
MKTPNGVIYSIKGKKLTNHETNFFKNTNPFGIILFSRNFENRKQIQELIYNLKNVTKNKNIQISVDQEGGKVQRFNNEDFFEYSPQNQFGSIYRKNPKAAKKIAHYFSYLIGYELKNIGIDINYSPVADIFLIMLILSSEIE